MESNGEMLPLRLLAQLDAVCGSEMFDLRQTYLIASNFTVLANIKDKKHRTSKKHAKSRCKPPELTGNPFSHLPQRDHAHSESVTPTAAMFVDKILGFCFCGRS